MFKKLLNLAYEATLSPAERHFIGDHYTTLRTELAERRHHTPDPHFSHSDNIEEDKQRILKQEGLRGLERVNNDMEEKFIALGCYLAANDHLTARGTKEQVAVFDDLYDKALQEAAGKQPDHQAASDKLHDITAAIRQETEKLHARNSAPPELPAPSQREGQWVVEGSEGWYKGESRGPSRH